MSKPNRFRDFTPTFWIALVSSITAAILAIAAYASMINDNTALIKASLIVICFEGGLITAMVVLNAKFQGLLKGWGFTLLFLIGMAEIFMASMEIQHGIAEAGANAENYQQSANNLGTVAAGMADATKALADCDKRYPRKKKDADARNQCRKPYEKIVAASAGAMPSGGNNAPQYDEENAGKLSQWQAVADVLNTTWQPEKPITWAQAAFYVMTAIMALFIIVKNFLWAKYTHGDELTTYLANQQTVSVPEHAIGNPASVDAESIADNDDEPEAQPAKVPFGFTGSKAAAASSADRNRALHARVDTRSDDLHAHVNTRPCNNTHDPLHARVNTRPRNNTHDDLHAAYTHAADANAGEHVNCPQCGTVFRKVNKQHTFCQKTCKDEWWNTKDPTRLEALKAIKRRKSA